MANLPLMISAYGSHSGFKKPPEPSGSRRPRGSKPLSPGSVPSRYARDCFEGKKRPLVSLSTFAGLSAVALTTTLFLATPAK
jgi:hypothetical protein